MPYYSLDAILQNQDADMGAAEAHGIASGMLCVEIRADSGNWLRELLPEEQALSENDEVLLLNLFETTRQLLDNQHGDFAFDLLLADDEDPLNEQVEALRNWCQGFLFGVGYAKSDANWPGEIAELMRDLIELTKLDSNVEGEEDASDFEELRQYVRAAVFTVRDHFAESDDIASH